MEHPIKIKFEFTNKFGEHYSAESELEFFEDFGENQLDILGRQFNNFLRQAGYVREHDWIMMESITEDEYADLLQYLDELRNN